MACQSPRTAGLERSDGDGDGESGLARRMSKERRGGRQRRKYHFSRCDFATRRLVLLSEPFVAAKTEEAHRQAHDTVRDPDRYLVESRPAVPIVRRDTPRSGIDHLDQLRLQLAIESVVAN